MKNKSELLIQNDALIVENSLNLITGQILNGHLEDIINSMALEEEQANDVKIASVVVPSVIVNGSQINLVIPYQPASAIQLFLNGEKYKVGSNINSHFYFKSSDGVIVRGSEDVQISDVLYYNSTILGFTLDALDKIEVTYLTMV